MSDSENGSQNDLTNAQNNSDRPTNQPNEEEKVSQTPTGLGTTTPSTSDLGAAE